MTKIIMEFVSDRADGTYHASPEVLLWLLVWHTKPKHLHQQPVLAREALNWKSWRINHTSPSADAAGGGVNTRRRLVGKAADCCP